MSGSKAFCAQVEILCIRSLQNVAIPHRLGRHEETNATFREAPFGIVLDLQISKYQLENLHKEEHFIIE
jgi:hypothetical protein